MVPRTVDPSPDQNPKDETMSTSTPEPDESTVDQTQQLPVTEHAPEPAYAPTYSQQPYQQSAQQSYEQSYVPVEPAAAGPESAIRPRRVRVAALVWGVVVVAVAAGLAAIANGVVFDVELAGIALVAAAGVALLVGSLAGARRRA